MSLLYAIAASALAFAPVAGATERVPTADAGATRSFVGERMEWDVRYGGVIAGTAWSEARHADGAVALVAGCRNADWYARIYTIDDLVTSTWLPGNGSTRYETRFREGGFHQDQVMHLAPDGFEVWRHQRIDGEWREWTTPYPSHPSVEDPVSALYALRNLTGDGPWTFPVFSGDKTWPLRVQPAGRDRLEDTVLGDIDVLKLELITDHDGEVEQKGQMLLYVTDDAHKVPVRVVVRTNVGPVRADLTAYTPPGG